MSHTFYSGVSHPAAVVEEPTLCSPTNTCPFGWCVMLIFDCDACTNCLIARLFGGRHLSTCDAAAKVDAEVTAGRQTPRPAAGASCGASIDKGSLKPASPAREQTAADNPTRRPVFVDGGSPAKTPAKAPAAGRSPAKRKENLGAHLLICMHSREQVWLALLRRHCSLAYIVELAQASVSVIACARGQDTASRRAGRAAAPLPGGIGDWLPSNFASST